ncbi:translation initiation factor 6 [Ignicoccus pacificus DSM 13166]|uniref:Translation initiation factor 6 n=1 Tax=Ignicoccus pacificus DSM 13166 TaxID=940294 RepID=A0A977KA42_9CREN|nr:translation initiation factor 6 [Ignicoccus pacificus DSM 13166]
MEFEVARISVFGNPNIGVYIFANDDFALIPPGQTEKVVKTVEETLRVRVIEMKIVDSSLLGLFIAGNNHAILVPSIAKEYEIEKLKKEVDLPVHVIPGRLTALGNVVLTNDHYALLHPEMEGLKKTISNALGVPAETGTIAKIPTVGSAAVFNDKGGLVHPEVSDEEAEELSQKFKVPVDVGTVNYGVPYVKMGVVANNKGALVGEQTTGPELARITQVLSGALGRQ